MCKLISVLMLQIRVFFPVSCPETEMGSCILKTSEVMFWRLKGSRVRESKHEVLAVVWDVLPCNLQRFWVAYLSVVFWIPKWKIGAWNTWPSLPHFKWSLLCFDSLLPHECLDVHQRIRYKAWKSPSSVLQSELSRLLVRAGLCSCTGNGGLFPLVCSTAISVWNRLEMCSWSEQWKVCCPEMLSGVWSVDR